MPLDTEFEAELGDPGLVERYRRAIRDAERAVDRRYKNDAAALADQKRAGLEREREHRNLLNCGVFPFTVTEPGYQELGYSFVRGSPLVEDGLPNFDFLIAKIQPERNSVRLLAGEGKSAVANPNAVIREVLEKKAVLTEHMGKVLTDYLGQPPTRDVSLDAIALVNSVDTDRVVAAAVAQPEPVCVWHSPVTGEPTLNCAQIPHNVPNRFRYFHNDHDLNAFLRSVPTKRRVFDLWPTSHAMIQLEVLIAACRPAREDARWMVVTPETVRAALDRDLFYWTDEGRAELSARIIADGVRIGFLAPTDVDNAYRTVARGLTGRVLERSLEEKWIKAQLASDRDREVETERRRMQEEFHEERSRMRTLEDF